MGLLLEILFIEKTLLHLYMGKKNICLAITEPYVGSDVANLYTRANKSKCGNYYFINGIKKWITGGMVADFFTTAVRTGKKGYRGVSALVIPRTLNVKTTHI